MPWTRGTCSDFGAATENHHVKWIVCTDFSQVLQCCRIYSSWLIDEKRDLKEAGAVVLVQLARYVFFRGLLLEVWRDWGAHRAGSEVFKLFEPMQTCELAVGHVDIEKNVAVWSPAIHDRLSAFLDAAASKIFQIRFAAAAKFPDQVMSKSPVETNLMDKTSPSRGKSPCLCLIQVTLGFCWWFDPARSCGFAVLDWHRPKSINITCGYFPEISLAAS